MTYCSRDENARMLVLRSHMHFLSKSPKYLGACKQLVRICSRTVDVPFQMQFPDMRGCVACFEPQSLHSRKCAHLSHQIRCGYPRESADVGCK